MFHWRTARDFIHGLLGTSYVVDAMGFAPVFITCGLLYPVGYGVILLSVRRRA